ncbi:zf-PARP-domain-containing protein [Trematosphaeria pertusa]|uniref:Zf-PARP-domain-containing protein n=1 Tax=Trematosphaeria pertusa TaxID=390896 RepID=A0A6A6I149_9PLEO|nr:zf-PARP-domain-containing protein [Trematosphaeria pertusa]KAF2244224.1 zf-PARP-domain-containing protein [Trematosphaeria pertusa]
MPYRVELAKQGRAGCKNKECKDAGVKIEKGEFRYGSLVTIHEHTSWAYKHWGCVTPAQIANLIEESEGDTDMVDGFDELPLEYQKKVEFALQHGHVPDEDWKGDVECNRPGMKGFRVKVKTPKKKKGKKADDEDADIEEAKPKKKRGRAVKEEDEGEVPAQKKARSKAKATVKEEDEAPAPRKARGKAKKAIVEEEEAPESEVEAPEPKAKKGRGRKAAVKKVVSEEEAESEVEVEAPKPKRGRKKAAAANTEEKSAPQKRSRRKKVTSEGD